MKLLNTFADQSLVATPVEVVCKKKVEDFELYPEQHMRLTILSIVSDHDGVMKMKVSYVKYDEYNKTYESSNYYDKNGQAVLTAREADCYKQVETIYVMADDNPNDYFTVLEESQSMAERFVDAYNAWMQNADHEDFKDYCKNNKILGKIEYHSHWNVKPLEKVCPDSSISYSIMDFSDGSIAIRRNWGEEKHSWRAC